MPLRRRHRIRVAIGAAPRRRLARHARHAWPDRLARLMAVATVIVGVATTILFGFLLAPRLGLSSMFGVLSRGAIAICGASAARRAPPVARAGPYSWSSQGGAPP